MRFHFPPLEITTPARGFTHVTGAPQVAGAGERHPVRQRGDERDKSGNQVLWRGERGDSESDPLAEYGRFSSCVHSGGAADRGVLEAVGERVQQLLGGVERVNVSRDEDRLPVEVDDGGDAGPARMVPRRVPLKLLRGLQETLVLLAVKLRREKVKRSQRSKHGGSGMIWKHGSGC